MTRAIKWFGKAWEAPVCQPDTKMEIHPTGAGCEHCQVPLNENEAGVCLPCVDMRDGVANGLTYVFFHVPCFVQEIIGDVANEPGDEDDDDDDDDGVMAKFADGMSSESHGTSLVRLFKRTNELETRVLALEELASAPEYSEPIAEEDKPTEGFGL